MGLAYRIKSMSFNFTRNKSIRSIASHGAMLYWLDGNGRENFNYDDQLGKQNRGAASNSSLMIQFRIVELIEWLFDATIFNLSSSISVIASFKQRPLKTNKIPTKLLHQWTRGFHFRSVNLSVHVGKKRFCLRRLPSTSFRHHQPSVLPLSNQNRNAEATAQSIFLHIPILFIVVLFTGDVGLVSLLVALRAAAYKKVIFLEDLLPWMTTARQRAFVQVADEQLVALGHVARGYQW